MLQIPPIEQGHHCSARVRKFHRSLFPLKGEQWMKDRWLYTTHKEWCWFYPSLPLRECIARCRCNPSGHNREGCNCCWRRLNHARLSPNSFHRCNPLEPNLGPLHQCRPEHSPSQKKCFESPVVSIKTPQSLCWLNCCFWLIEPWRQLVRRTKAPPTKVLYSTLVTRIFFLGFHNKYTSLKNQPLPPNNSQYCCFT